MRALDLCCGRGGWARGLMAAGWEVVGYDVVPQPLYPGEFRLGDVRELVADELLLEDFRFCVASPPCEEFSRHGIYWCKRLDPPPPDLSIWRACEGLAAALEVPIVIENVRSAIPFVGWHVGRVGSRFLWGDVPVLMPDCRFRDKRQAPAGPNQRAVRAEIPFDLALWVGQAFMMGENR